MLTNFNSHCDVGFYSPTYEFRHRYDDFLFLYGMTLMGFTYGPLGTFLSELFPTSVRYSGASLTFNLAGIGAAFAPMIAIWLATNYSLTYVGFYLTFAAIICSPY
jgi:MFS family permease